MKPILSIWITPRKTFVDLSERNEEKNEVNVTLLFILFSMTAGFSNASDFNKLLDGNFYLSLLIGMVVAGLVGLFMLNSVVSILYYWTSKLFQGKAEKDEIKITLAYSLVPNLVYLIIGLVLIIPSIILDNKEIINFHHPVLSFGLWLISFRALVYGLAYFNKYSYLYALLTALIPPAIFQGLLFGLKFIIDI
ncbi:MAG: YIP1 family protein [Salinivirgaceae bacterium]